MSIQRMFTMPESENNSRRLYLYLLRPEPLLEHPLLPLDLLAGHRRLRRAEEQPRRRPLLVRSLVRTLNEKGCESGGAKTLIKEYLRDL